VTEPAPLPFLAALRSFRGAFWAGNVMEMFERLAYYGVRVVVPIYIASTQDPNGLHFTNTEKGEILALWAAVQTLVPMFSGGFADRYGRKRTILVSIALKVLGYLLMATQRTYGGFLGGCLVLAVGTAIFKPGLWGTLAAAIDEKRSSLGWGIFYWLVNVGGFLGPPLAGYLHAHGWKWVFFSCAAIVSLNIPMLLTYEDSGATGTGTPIGVFVDSIRKLVRRPRALAFIAIMSAYCCMFMQLYDALPNFIEEWTDSSDLVRLLGLGEGHLARATPRGLQVPQEWMINLDAGMILLFMVPVSALAGKMRLLWVMVLGIALSCGGLLLAGGTTHGVLCLAGIFTFAVGEMLASPKLNEYLALIAPKGEEGLYMGYANVPWAVGWTSGAYVAGRIYERVADKANLASRYLREHGHGDVARSDAFARLQEILAVDAREGTRLLWDAYHPYAFWYGFVALGGLSAILLFSYAKAATRWQKTG
jgi:proton-dependent oligopeptide transporter, POT family